MKKKLTPKNPILIVDDEKHALESFNMTLLSLGFNHKILCNDSRNVMMMLSEQKVELILLDLIMPHISGEELLDKISSEYPEIPVIIVTGVNELKTAVRCMRQGAFDYILKPVDKDRLKNSIRLITDMIGLKRENTNLKKRIFCDKLENPQAFSNILTLSRAMQSVFLYCEAIKESNQPVLITGETGVGKELIASALHSLSQCDGAFIPVNISGLDDNMINDTLFGHVKGAFTGANSVRKGLFEKAANGTIFLDEIGDLSHNSQVKLLRVLQENEYYPVGSDIPKPTNARVLVATHRDLAKRQKSGKFRQDLYYRLKAHHIHIPPLRERLEDIPLLLDKFIKKAANDLGKTPPSYHQELVSMLCTYSFPGNVREFISMVYDAISQHKDKMLSGAVFKKTIQSAQSSGTSDIMMSNKLDEFSWATMLQKLPTLKDASQILVKEAMRRANNNQRIAADLLGISYQALNKRLNQMIGNDEA